MNESISTSAGAQYGQLIQPRELRRLIRDAGRIPAQRKTNYRLLKVYDKVDEETGWPGPGDRCRFKIRFVLEARRLERVSLSPVNQGLTCKGMSEVPAGIPLLS